MQVHVRVFFLPELSGIFTPKGNFWEMRLIYQYWKFDELKGYYMPVV
jgi:hypothetical protein